MKQYEEKLQKYIEDNNIPCEYLQFEESCHSVLEAANAAGVEPDDCVKNICLIDSEDNLIGHLGFRPLFVKQTRITQLVESF